MTKIGNWHQDQEEAVFKARGQHVLGYGGEFRSDTEATASFTPEGRTGEALAASLKDAPKGGRVELPKQTLFTHGDMGQPPVECFASTNQLTYKAPGAPREPRVQSYLWSGRNKLDAQVPTSADVPISTVSLKKAQWRQEAAADPYMSTSRAAALDAALHAAGTPTKQEGCHKTVKLAEGAQPRQVGRKPVGPFASELDKAYRATGLRG